jgi:acetyl esterase/lipase
MTFFSQANYGNIPLPSNDMRISPSSASSHQGLAPHTIIAAPRDPLVDEGVLYAAQLRTAGVSVDYYCFENTVHGFYTWYFLPEARQALQVTIAAATGTKYTVPPQYLCQQG